MQPSHTPDRSPSDRAPNDRSPNVNAEHSNSEPLGSLAEEIGGPLRQNLIKFSDYVREDHNFVPHIYVTRQCVTAEERAFFVAERNRLTQDLAAFLTPFTLEQYDKLNIELYITPCGRGGYGIADGELVSLFSLRGAGLGRPLVHDAIARGAWWLECLDAKGILGKFYSSFGFVEVERSPWEERYAPPNWNYERFGTADLIKMELRR